MPLQNFAVVTPWIYRGAEPDADGYESLRALGVQWVYRLNVGAEPIGWKGVSNLLGRSDDLASTWNPDEAAVRDAVAYLEAAACQAQSRVYVHCQHGRDRTGLVIGAYRLIEQGWTLDAVMSERALFGTNPFLDATSDAVIVHILADIAHALP